MVRLGKFNFECPRQYQYPMPLFGNEWIQGSEKNVSHTYLSLNTQCPVYNKTYVCELVVSPVVFPSKWLGWRYRLAIADLRKMCVTRSLVAYVMVYSNGQHTTGHASRATRCGSSPSQSVVRLTGMVTAACIAFTVISFPQSHVFSMPMHSIHTLFHLKTVPSDTFNIMFCSCSRRLGMHV